MEGFRKNGDQPPWMESVDATSERKKDDTKFKEECFVDVDKPVRN